MSDTESKFRAAQAELAAEHIRKTYSQSLCPNTHPLVQLIALSLKENGTVSIEPPPEIPITYQQWDAWTWLSASAEEELVTAVIAIMIRECRGVPAEPTDLSCWAAGLVLLTLDKMDELEW